MKRLIVLALAVSVLLSVAGLAQGMSQGDAKTDKSATAPLKDIKGTVKAEGDKISFVSDSDSKAWDVINPEALKGHEGHHVQVSAHVYADKGQIHVMSVKMLKDKMSK
jgi:hypothetical protein